MNLHQILYQHPWSNKTAAKVKLISDAFSPSVRNQRTGDGQRLQPFFSLGNKKPRLVSIHAESTGVTRVFEVRPVLEGSGRDADPCQRQLLGPSVITKMIALQRTGGEGGTELEVHTQKNTLCNRSKKFSLINLDQIWAKPWAT